MRRSGQIERLIAAGFEPARAAEIVEQDMRLRSAAIDTELETTRTVRALSFDRRVTHVNALREALGDGDYERYLLANGRSTHVRISGIMPDSPAAHAGLETEDLVVAYAGQRVFDLRELNQLAHGGTVGETVPLTVIRDGEALQLYVARGPLGIGEDSLGVLDAPR